MDMMNVGPYLFVGFLLTATFVLSSFALGQRILIPITGRDDGGHSGV